MGLIDNVNSLFFGNNTPLPVVIDINDVGENDPMGFDIVNEFIAEINTRVYTEGDVILWGKDNKRILKLQSLYKLSPTHANIINYKRDFLSKGYEFLNVDSIEDRVKLDYFKNQILNSGDDFDDFDDFLRRLTLEYLISGNVFLQVCKNDDGKIYEISVISSDKVRIRGNEMTEKKTGYAIRNNWIEYNGVSYNLPIFREGSKSDKKSMLCYSNKIPGAKFYGEPDWEAGYDSIEIDCNIANFHKKNILNGINLSGILSFYEYPKDPEKRAKWLRNLTNTLTGSSNAGRVFLSLGTNKDLTPQFTGVNSSSLDKAFINLSEDIQRNICKAHGIAPSVVGFKSPGSLGENSEIEHLTKEFEKRMTGNKKIVEDIMNRLLTITGNENIKFRYV